MKKFQKKSVDFLWIQPPLSPIENIGPQTYFELCEEIMPKVVKFTDESLDDIIITELDKRVPLIPPTNRWIRLRAGWQADEIWQNHSYNQLANKHPDKQFLCLSRTLLQHAFVYWVEGYPLDTKTITLAAASRFAGGGVQSVDWLVSRLEVRLYGSDRANGYLRFRQAVS